MKNNKLSLLFPDQERVEYRMISEETWHDLGLDALTEMLTAVPQEQMMIAQVMRSLTADPAVTAFRCGVFEDMLRHPEIREKIAPPEGKSFAREIAVKYGVTYDALVGG